MSAFITDLEVTVDPNWYMDNKVTDNITNESKTMSNKVDYRGSEKLSIGNKL